MKRPRRVLFLNDLHAGSNVAPWPDGYKNEDGAPIGCSPAQAWLAKCWAEMAAEAKEKRPDVLIVAGDAIQGVNLRDGQLMAANVDVQQGACEALLEPVVSRARETYFLKGTAFHDGRAGEAMEAVARHFEAVPDPATGKHARWELYLDMGGPVIHAAHHIGVTSLPQYEAGAPLRDMLNLLTELVRNYAERAPNLRAIVRAHRHRCVHVEVPPGLHAVVFPGWQLKTEYAHKKASASLPQIGYGWLEWDGVDLVVRSRHFALPALRVEVLPGGADHGAG